MVKIVWIGPLGKPYKTLQAWKGKISPVSADHETTLILVH